MKDCIEEITRFLGTGWKTRSLLEQNLHTSGKFYIQCTGSHFNCNVHQYSLDGNISTESFPFLPEIFFVKDCIEEITRFVAAVWAPAAVT